METVIQIAIAMLASIGIIAIGVSLYGAFTNPVKGVNYGNLYAVLSVSGGAPGLELTVRKLMAMKDGAPGMKILIADAGMDEETSKVAEMLKKDNNMIELCKISEITDYIG